MISYLFSLQRLWIMSPVALFERPEADAMHWDTCGKRWRALPGTCLEPSTPEWKNIATGFHKVCPRSCSMPSLVAQLMEETIPLLNSQIAPSRKGVQAHGGVGTIIQSDQNKLEKYSGGKKPNTLKFICMVGEPSRHIK